MVHHTDADREWAYDRTSHIGQLARALDEAPKRGWILAEASRHYSPRSAGSAVIVGH